jgi:hypothetical protein
MFSDLLFHPEHMLHPLMASARHILYFQPFSYTSSKCEKFGTYHIPKRFSPCAIWRWEYFFLFDLLFPSINLRQIPEPSLNLLACLRG